MNQMYYSDSLALIYVPGELNTQENSKSAT